MGKATTKISFAAWVNHKHVIAKGLIRVFFEDYIVKLWNIVFKFFLFHDLFNKVLPVVPSPWFIYFAKILYYEAALFNSVTINTNGSFTFSMNTK